MKCIHVYLGYLFSFNVLTAKLSFKPKSALFCSLQMEIMPSEWLSTVQTHLLTLYGGLMLNRRRYQNSFNISCLLSGPRTGSSPN